MDDKALSPAQRVAYDALLAACWADIPICVLVCPPGYGRSTVLRSLAVEFDAPLVGLADCLPKISDHHPLQLEESLLETVLSVFGKGDVVIVDDLHVMLDLFASCTFAARPPLLPLVLESLLAAASGAGKQLILGSDRPLPPPVHERGFYQRIDRFAEEDFEHLYRAFLGAKVDDVDFFRAHRAAPSINAHQVRRIADDLTDAEQVSTMELIEAIERRALVSNVDPAELEEVSLDDLHGIEDVREALEADVLVPIERADLAAELGLEPKRGVLLHGPPGTGKTTVGRALAHRLRSRFFLIDGTVISGTSSFYREIGQIFNAARENQPSLIFIDDSDVIFEQGDETGLYRYLLTKLDGLRNDAQVTIVLTAMKLESLPPALIRSGRIELWLSMKPPAPAARRAILGDLLASRGDVFQDVDLVQLAETTDGLVGADFRRLVSDAVNLYGYDRARDRKPRGVEVYFAEALRRLREQQERLAQARKRMRKRKRRATGYEALVAPQNPAAAEAR